MGRCAVTPRAPGPTFPKTENVADSCRRALSDTCTARLGTAARAGVWSPSANTREPPLHRVDSLRQAAPDSLIAACRPKPTEPLRAPTFATAISGWLSDSNCGAIASKLSMSGLGIGGSRFGLNQIGESCSQRFTQNFSTLRIGRGSMQIPVLCFCQRSQDSFLVVEVHHVLILAVDHAHRPMP